MIERVQVPKRILKEYKRLDVSGLKLYYYFIGKVQTIGLAFKRNNETMQDFEEIGIYYNEIKITYNELKVYLRLCRVDKGTLYNPITQINDLGLFGDITLGKKDVIIEFNEKIFELLNEVDCVSSNNEIDLRELSKLKDKYSINLYLYCLTILRLKNGKGEGSIQISIDKLKKVLTNGHCNSNDINFYKAFITRRIKHINEVTSLDIESKRRGKNVEFKVKK